MEDVLEAVEVSHENLTRLLAAATPEAALISGSMCLYRVLPVLHWGESPEFCESVVNPDSWRLDTFPDRIGGVLDRLRGEIDSGRFAQLSEEIGEVYSMASEMVLRYFLEEFEIGDWSDWCSTLCLDINQQFDDLLGGDDAPNGAVFFTAGEIPDLTPLEELELKDQILTLTRLGDDDPVVRQSVLEIAGKGYVRTRTVLEQII